MQTSDERAIAFAHQAITQATDAGAQGVEWDCRKGSFRSCVPVVEIRLYQNYGDNGRPFEPIAIIEMVNPDKPSFFVKTAQSGVVVVKEFQAEVFSKGLRAELLQARNNSNGLFLCLCDVEDGSSARSRQPQ